MNEYVYFDIRCACCGGANKVKADLANELYYAEPRHPFMSRFVEGVKQLGSLVTP